MKSLLQAISPTAAALLDPDVYFFTVTYWWNDPLLGELRNSTIITGSDAEAALKHFLSLHRHLAGARIV
jgi:hypothetical protein